MRASGRIHLSIRAHTYKYTYNEVYGGLIYGRGLGEAEASPCFKPGPPTFCDLFIFGVYFLIMQCYNEYVLF